MVAGFHTGRASVAGFFETALKNGFEIGRIFERDLISRAEDGEQIRREWVPVREEARDLVTGDAGPWLQY